MTNRYFETFVRAASSYADGPEFLGGDRVLLPPNPDFGYDATPENALTFATMGVDGVHFALLLIDGEVRGDSPVVHVGPMDFSREVLIVAESFLDYLSRGCDLPPNEMSPIFDTEDLHPGTLIPFIADRFDGDRLLDESRIAELTLRHLHLVQSKPHQGEP